MPDDTLINNLQLTLDGQIPPTGMLISIEQIVVETSLHLPSVATLVLHDPQLLWVDSALLLPGKALCVTSASGAALFDGEIVELDAEFSEEGQRVIVRAFDRLHRLARGSHSRAFTQVTDSDLVKTCGGEVGLSVDATATSGQHPYYIQANETNLAMLQRRAAANGYLLFVEGVKLCFKPPTSTGTFALEWGLELSSFRPRLSSLGYLEKLSVRGWDMKTKKPVVGVAQASKLPPEVGLSAQNFFGSIKPVDSHADLAIQTQQEAKQLAQGLIDTQASRFIEAEGVARGDARIKAGVSVKIQGVGSRFSGTYFVTSATHRIVPGHSYSTELSVSGMNPASILGLLAPPEAERQPLGGLTVGIVTDNNDPDKLGRIKVKFPLLYDEQRGCELSSDWVRMLGCGAGDRRGMLFLPEVNDEVVVAFGQGDLNAAFILGALWNGLDKPPTPAGQLVDGSGKVVKRVIYSRTGHYIMLDDSDADSGISIVDKKGNKLVFKAQDNSLTVETAGPITLKTKGNFALEVGGNASLKATGNFAIEANGNLTFKANGNLKAESTGQAELSGTSGAKLTSSAIVDIKGAMINLN